MSFTDGKPRTATTKDCAARWGGSAPGVLFRCAMCGHRFQVGDAWRFVYTNGLEAVEKNGRVMAWYGGNPLVCAACDGPDIIERWKARCDEMYSDRNWWFTIAWSER